MRSSIQAPNNLHCKRKSYSEVPPLIHWVAALLLIPSLLGPDPLLSAVTIVVGVLIVHMVWRQGETQTLLFICAYQWLQVFAPVLQAHIAGVPLVQLLGGLQFVNASWLSLAGVAVFSAGAGYALRRVAPKEKDGANSPIKELVGINQFNLVAFWAGIFLADAVVSGVVRIPGINVAWQPIAMLRFGAALLLFQSVFANNRGWGYLLLVAGVECVVGFLGYFSGFKLVFYLLILGASSLLHYRPSVRFPFAVCVLLLLGFALTWQTIKRDYRMFLSGGEREQSVTVSVEERLNYLSQSVRSLNADSFAEAAERSLSRIGYVTYFGHCLSNVPNYVPHAGGRLWKEALMNVFMPRILFPNKMVFNDSARTNEFSGIQVAGAHQGTSIGIGYVGESYIDFGVPGMFVPIGFFGLFVGAGYGFVLRTLKPHGVGVAMGTSLLFASNLTLESSNAKMMGAFMSSFLVYWVIIAIQQRYILNAPSDLGISSDE